MDIVGLDHVQLAMPRGGEEKAREFYGRFLNLLEIPKPEGLIGRGGCWFAVPGVQLHLGVQDDFIPASKAHPALLVRDLEALYARLMAADVVVIRDEAVQGVHRFYALDPFGNRLEFIQDGNGFSQEAPL
ncbi:MAG: glyoxalase [Chloroflexota bacterium]|nr:hypothetical protein [Anaerolineales bacterium]MCB8966279.1 glyoxalase [Ardenticatenaceae bacterium]